MGLRRINLSVGEDLKPWLAAEAKRRRMSQSALVRQWVGEKYDAAMKSAPLMLAESPPGFPARPVPGGPGPNPTASSHLASVAAPNARRGKTAKIARPERYKIPARTP